MKKRKTNDQGKERKPDLPQLSAGFPAVRRARRGAGRSDRRQRGSPPSGAGPGVLVGWIPPADRLHHAPFTLEDAAKNIDKILTQIEEDRAVAAELSIPERFARVMEEFRKIKPRDGMIGEVRIPNGDRGHCFFMANYDGGVHLEGVGEVAEARAPWRRDESYEGHLARFCDALEADFEWRLEVRTE
jgi:hypothetical protein